MKRKYKEALENFNEVSKAFTVGKLSINNCQENFLNQCFIFTEHMDIFVWENIKMRYTITWQLKT